MLPGVMGLLQANEVIKLILGIGEPLIGRLLMFDALQTEFTELKLRRNDDCPVCGVVEPQEAQTPELALAGSR